MIPSHIHYMLNVPVCVSHTIRAITGTHWHAVVPFSRGKAHLNRSTHQRKSWITAVPDDSIVTSTFPCHRAIHRIMRRWTVNAYNKWNCLQINPKRSTNCKYLKNIYIYTYIHYLLKGSSHQLKKILRVLIRVERSDSQEEIIKLPSLDTLKVEDDPFKR